MGVPLTAQLPLKNPISDSNGLISSVWLFFFRSVQEILNYLGIESVFTLVNNQALALEITQLSFDYRYTSQVSIDYLIQRTTSTNESVETGTFFLAYRPRANTWAISSGPTTAGITLTVTSDGQVKYTSTNITGTISISRIVFRARAMSGKSNLYSKLGGNNT